jgi:hypothetical protein
VDTAEKTELLSEIPLVRTASWVGELLPIRLLKGNNLKIFNEADFSADRPLREDEKLPILPEDTESQGSDPCDVPMTWSTFNEYSIWS